MSNTIRFKTMYPGVSGFLVDYAEFGVYTPVNVTLEEIYKRLFIKLGNRQIRYIGVDYFKQNFMYDLSDEITDLDFKLGNEITNIDLETITEQSSDLTTKDSPQDLDITLYDTRKELEVLSLSIKDKDKLEIQKRLQSFTKNYFSTIIKALLKHFSMFDYEESEEDIYV